jgi:hypothetical protein
MLAAMRWLLAFCVKLCLWMNPFFLPALEATERAVSWLLKDGAIYCCSNFACRLC